MNDIIQLPANARSADFAPYVAEGEVKGLICETLSGKKHIEAAPGAAKIGDRIVRFERVNGPRVGRQFGPHLGFRKYVTQYVITGVGAEYRRDGETIVNYYVCEG